MDLSGSWSYIEGIAKERLRNNKTSRHVADYGTDIEILGAAGEIAARRFLGLPEKLHTHFDKGTDIRFAGRKIDVKATRLTNKVEYRCLQWPYQKPIRSNIILLTAVSIPIRTAVVIGYARKVEILRAPVNLERAYPCHEISVKELHPASKLLTLANEPFLSKTQAFSGVKHNFPSSET